MSSRRDDGPGDFQDSLAAASDEAAILDIAAETARRFGLNAYLLTTIPLQAADTAPGQVIATSLPPELLSRRDRAALLRDGRLLGALRRSVLPIAWTADALDEVVEAGERAATAALLNELGLATGLFVPVHSPEGERAAVCWFGARCPLARHEIAELVMLSIHIFEALNRVRRLAPSEWKKLSDREVEVLGWAANGKTSVEIAAILSLSDHTVNSYLNSAMRKLDCVNRTQLVAKALRLRIIS